MNELSLTLLPETEEDAEAVERLHERIFGPGRFAKTAYRLREQAAHRLSLSFTARVGTLLVGSVRLTPVRIGATAAVLLGPLTVEPAFRERGVGQALIARALEAAAEERERLVLLVGDESYYGKCGFKRIAPGRLVMPGPVDPDRVLVAELAPGAFDGVSGRVRGNATTGRDASPSLARPGAGETAEQQQQP